MQAFGLKVLSVCLLLVMSITITTKAQWVNVAPGGGGRFSGVASHMI